jgi:hypothetical protein
MARRYGLLAALLGWGCPGAGQSQPVALDSHPAESVLALADFQVQSGSVVPLTPLQLAIRTPMTRAILPRQAAAALELRFVYRGPTGETVPLASGEIRRQIGVELRVRDTCNLVYVMWHIQPTQGVHVAVKSNPSETWNSQCHDRGYVPVAPSFSIPDVGRIEPDQARVLAAEIDDNELRVFIDGALVWSGQLPPEAANLRGPFGVRSDNGQFDLEVVAHRGLLAPTSDADARAIP